MSKFKFGGKFVWHPTPELIAQSDLQRFIEKHGLSSYDELIRRSTMTSRGFENAASAKFPRHVTPDSSAAVAGSE